MYRIVVGVDDSLGGRIALVWALAEAELRRGTRGSQRLVSSIGRRLEQ